MTARGSLSRPEGSGGARVSSRSWRLAVCLSHPIQYKVPLLQRLSVHPAVGVVKAFFYSDMGLVSRPNRYHGTTAKWDRPLLKGYEFELLGKLRPNQNRSSNFNPSLMGRLIREPWDAVIIHSYLYPNDWLAWLAMKLKGGAVLFYGDMYPRAYPNGFKRLVASLPKRLMLSSCTACLAIGSVAAEVYKELGVPGERIFLAPYAVDNDFFIGEAERLKPRQAELKAEWGVPADVPVVLCVAGMVPKKRHQDLIEAMASLKTSARLMLVGHGPLFDDIKSLCEQRLPEAILTGFKNQSELPRLYAMADVFVLPSLWEEFGLVVNEAMCFSLPIITSNTVAASRDLVRCGVNGFTFPPGDVRALAANLESLLADAVSRRTFGERSREIITHWNYDRTVQGILDAMTYLDTRSARSNH